MPEASKDCTHLSDCPTWKKFGQKSQAFWIKIYCQGPKQDDCCRKKQIAQKIFIPDELLPNGDYLTPTGTKPTECPHLKTCPIWENFRSDAKMLWMKAYCQGPKMNSCARKQRTEAGKEVANTLLPNGDQLIK